MRSAASLTEDTNINKIRITEILKKNTRFDKNYFVQYSSSIRKQEREENVTIFIIEYYLSINTIKIPHSCPCDHERHHYLERQGYKIP